MSPLVYHRPKTMAEAIGLLDRAIPLGGGTALVPERLSLYELMDVQDLGIDTIESDRAELKLGAFIRLQTMLEATEAIHPAFGIATRLEAGWNIRNAGTLAGVLVSGDGRSPLLILLLACSSTIELEPGGQSLNLSDILKDRSSSLKGKLITAVRIPISTKLAYHQVARSPADKPLVAAAVALFLREGEKPILRVSIGGHGEIPILLQEFSGSQEMGFNSESIVKATREAYAAAEDPWASSAYREDVAGILVRRALREVLD